MKRLVPGKAKLTAAGFAAYLSATLVAGLAFAHSGDIGTGGLTAGAMHPVFGLDHLLAMVTIGIWGAELGAPAVWLLPITFPMMMAVGGVFGILGVPVPASEVVVALSVFSLGVLVAGAWRVPLAAALAIVAVFALAHGYAHGVELPASADALAFTIGFVVATGCLHLAGIAIGLLGRWRGGMVGIRTCGVLVAVAGCYFLLGNGKI